MPRHLVPYLDTTKHPRLRAYQKRMEEMHLTIHELARRTGICRLSIWSIFNRSRNVSWETEQKLIAVLGNPDLEPQEHHTTDTICGARKHICYAYLRGGDRKYPLEKQQQELQDFWKESLNSLPTVQWVAEEAEAAVLPSYERPVFAGILRQMNRKDMVAVTSLRILCKDTEDAFVLSEHLQSKQSMLFALDCLPVECWDSAALLACGRVGLESLLQRKGKK